MSPFATPYPGYDIRAKASSPSWDEVTRRVVDQRVNAVPGREFLSEAEWRTLEAVCARLIPQPDRGDEPIPIVPWIDHALCRGEGDGYRYADMPPGRDAWRLGLEGLEAESVHAFGRAFGELDGDEQDALLRVVERGEVSAGVWLRLPPRRFFAHTLLRTVVGAYYAHPAALSEIGFGGPASPRGYVRLGPGERDPWEAEERHDGR
ncbi:MAG TPA: gluconate 2-dehydrogenase subunit 3 family protein [Longimicrobium sp.]|nr:gluconate 2-dehydrogenase subunit 3 family protein [Longimicrobium sp.]